MKSLSLDGIACCFANGHIILTMSPAIARSTLVRSAATRTVARRQMSTAPKLHKSSDKWSEFVSKRPPKDELDTHVR